MLPPEVDFNTPWLNLKALQAQRQMLQSVAGDIRGSLQDVDRFENEAILDATFAAAWAATLMVCDILKIGLSAADKRADLLFKQQDDLIKTANKVLKLLGARTITTKADLMRSLGPEVTTASRATETVRTTMEQLRRMKVPTTRHPLPVAVPKEAGLLVDLGVAMAQDTLLLLEAGNLQRRANVTAAQSRMQMRQSLNKVLSRIMLVEGEITREIERLQRLGRTA